MSYFDQSVTSVAGNDSKATSKNYLKNSEHRADVAASFAVAAQEEFPLPHSLSLPLSLQRPLTLISTSSFPFLYLLVPFSLSPSLSLILRFICPPLSIS